MKCFIIIEDLESGGVNVTRMSSKKIGEEDKVTPAYAITEFAEHFLRDMFEDAKKVAIVHRATKPADEPCLH